MKKKENKKFSPLWIIIPLSVMIIGFLFFVPFWINSAYIEGGDYKTVWTGAEFLAFYGAALSAIGALFLGGLSIWQNRQIQKSNESAQKRLESISYNANEISIINKIVERENNRVERLATASDSFAQLCIASDLSKRVAESKSLSSTISRIRIELFNEKQNVGREMAGDLLNGKIGVEFIKKATILYDASIKLYEKAASKPEEILNGEFSCDEITNAYSDFIIVKDEYLVQAQDSINSILLGKTTLSEIKAKYHYSMEEENGQAEDGE